MVDLLGMFRRRPAKRSPPGFARSREDITALGDSIGDLLTSPVRDAPPMASTSHRPRRAAVKAECAGSRGNAAPAAGQKQCQDQRRRRATTGDAGRLPGCA